MSKEEDGSLAVARSVSSAPAEPASRNWLPISTAPANGELIELCAMGADGPEDVCVMRWSPTMRNGMFPGEQGFWVAPDASFTWRPGEFGPTHWRMTAARSEAQATQRPEGATPPHGDHQ